MVVDNLIIKRNDPRYGKIGHLMNKYKIFNKYSLGNLVKNTVNTAYSYFIPPELVINEYLTHRVQVYNKSNYIPGSNFVDSKSFNRIIRYSCDISPEDYFLLFELTTNDRTNYMRCPTCGKRMNFINVLRGYGSNGRMWNDVPRHTCSFRCLDYYKHSHPEIYGDFGLRNWIINAKTHYTWFLNQGDLNDTCYFYITSYNKLFGYGITGNLDYRTHTYNSFEKADCRLVPIFTSTRLNVAKLEYQIKCELNSGKEFYEFKGLMGDFRKAYRIAMHKVLTNTTELD